MKTVALIMAGGIGERFWPLSTKDHPKQVLDVFTGKPLIVDTINRLKPIFDINDIYIATNSQQLEILKAVLIDFPFENFILEPAFKDTAAAIGYSTIRIKERYNNNTIISVFASDHIIKDEKKFRDNVIQAQIKAQENFIVTFGIVPTEPNVNYGYIKVEDYSTNLFTNAISFMEKPEYKTAKLYYDSKSYLWNSGMFTFQISTILDSFKIHAFNHYQILMDLSEYNNSIIDNFKKFQTISIDYAIMEKANNIVVLPIDVGWNDVGNFSNFDEIYDKNSDGNLILEKHVKIVDSYNNIIFSDSEDVKIIGVKNLIIVKKENSILISTKDKIHKIKKVLK